MPEKSANAEHTLTLGHKINWAGPKVIVTAAGTIKRQVKEKLHLEKVPGSKPVMNKDGGLNIEKVWQTNSCIWFFSVFVKKVVGLFR